MQLSVVIPVHNEKNNINELHKRLKPVLNKLSRSHEIIFINDGSTDNTLQKLLTLRKKDKKIKIIHFSRNFGHMPAVSAGLKHATGNKTVIMDADLQDPPEVIPRMYKKSKKYQVVYGVKTQRKEGVVKKFMFSSFYQVIGKISQVHMPANAGTFSIIDKKIVNLINTLPEKNKYFSGLRAWTGFTQTSVTYKRAARFAGSPVPFSKLVKLALSGLVSFSHIPLRLASFLGFITAAVALVFIIIVLTLRIFFNFGLIGWASTLSAILLLGGIQLITLGIIGEYLARIYDEVKNRPDYVISKTIGFRKKRS